MYIYFTCDKQTFHYSDKVWFILNDATYCSLVSIRIPQILMIKRRSMSLYIKVNTICSSGFKKFVLVFKRSIAKVFLKVLKLHCYLLNFFEKRIAALFFKVLSGFQRLSRNASVFSHENNCEHLKKAIKQINRMIKLLL